MLAHDQRIHGVEQCFADVTLADEAAHSDLFGLVDQMCAFVHGIKEDGHLGQELAQFYGRGESAEHRHGQIEDDQIGFQSERLPERLASIAGLAAHLDIGS